MFTEVKKTRLAAYGTWPKPVTSDTTDEETEDTPDTEDESGKAKKKAEVKFDAEQQKVINERVAARLARQKKQLDEQHKKELVDLESKLRAELLADEDEDDLDTTTEEEEETPPKKVKKSEEDDAKRKQMKQLLKSADMKTKNAELLKQKAESEAQKARDEAMKVRKESAITRAMTKGVPEGFIDPDEVMSLTEKHVQWSEEHNRFVIMEDGTIKENANLQPMTLEEFYSEYAEAKPHHVKGSMIGGASSSESAKSKTSVGTAKYKSELRTHKEKSDYIEKYGLEKWEKLPARPPVAQA